VRIIIILINCITNYILLIVNHQHHKLVLQHHRFLIEPPASEILLPPTLSPGPPQEVVVYEDVVPWKPDGILKLKKNLRFEKKKPLDPGAILTTNVPQNPSYTILRIPFFELYLYVSTITTATGNLLQLPSPKKKKILCACLAF
jgi:hypothetical protein